MEAYMFHVMIVDDEQLTRSFLSKAVPRLDNRFQVTCVASDGAEALQLLTLHKIDVVITDIKMPIMDGVTLCEHLYQDYPDIRLIILSGYGEFDYAKKAIHCQVVQYLLKPIINEELSQVLNYVGDYLTQKSEEKRSLNTLLGLSRMFKEEIAKQFLQVVIQDSYIKTQALLPIIYEHHKELMLEEGVILLVVPSKKMLYRPNYLKNQDITNLLIYQTALEQLKNTSYVVSTDRDGRTVIYLSYEHQNSLSDLILSAFTPIFQSFYETTTYELDCIAGEPVSELLQLAASYQSAIDTMHHNYLSDFISSSNENEDMDSLIVKHCHLTKRLKDQPILHPYIAEISAYIYAVRSQDLHNIRQARVGLYIIPEEYAFFVYSLLRNSLVDNSIFYPKTLTICHLLDSYEKSLGIYEESLTDDSLIEAATKYIQQHYEEPISLSVIADYLSISPSYLSNIFHESTGKSYIKYLTDLRMKEACQLLRNNKNMTLETITQRVGYLSVKHFSYVFKKQYGITPGQYRRQEESLELDAI
jgi:Response regulator containing CheY-like receiver domain and AraC-type DNA-binding domain